MTLKKRSYKQHCPLACGLDVIGERWTLLIVRDLLIGPKRFKELLSGVSGMGTNLLADRLKALAKSGLIEQTVLPPPAASTVYQLTEQGRQLEGPVLALARWGLQFLGDRETRALSRPEWSLMTLKGAFNPEAAKDFNLCCEWHVDGLLFYIRVHLGHLSIALGKAKDAVARVTTDGESLAAVVSGKRGLKEVIQSGDFKITGSGLAVVRMTEMFRVSTSNTTLHNHSAGL